MPIWENALVPTLQGKIAIVTGASSGLGEAAALKLAREGAKVVVAARREDKSRAVVAKLEELGGDVFFIRTDVNQRREIQAMVEGTLERFGKLDCAVNNAGIVGPNLTPVADIEEEGWERGSFGRRERARTHAPSRYRQSAETTRALRLDVPPKGAPRRGRTRSGRVVLRPGQLLGPAVPTRRARSPHRSRSLTRCSNHSRGAGAPRSSRFSPRYCLKPASVVTMR